MSVNNSEYSLNFNGNICFIILPHCLLPVSHHRQVLLAKSDAGIHAVKRFGRTVRGTPIRAPLWDESLSPDSINIIKPTRNHGLVGDFHRIGTIDRGCLTLMGSRWVDLTRFTQQNRFLFSFVVAGVDKPEMVIHR